MSGHHRPKHLRPSARAPWAEWARSMLAASLLIGVAGVMAFRPTTTAAEATAPPTTIGPEADGDAITPCTRASLEDRAALVLVLGIPGVTDADRPADRPARRHRRGWGHAPRRQHRRRGASAGADRRPPRASRARPARGRRRRRRAGQLDGSPGPVGPIGPSARRGGPGGGRDRRPGAGRAGRLARHRLGVRARGRPRRRARRRSDRRSVLRFRSDGGGRGGRAPLRTGSARRGWP